MPETPKPLRIFLSYAHADLTSVRKLHRYLREKGFEVWFDRENLMPGQNWRLEIEKGLNNSDVVIICLSPATVNKEGYAQKEIRFALERGMEMPEGRIFLIPVRLEVCDVPTRLGDYQWVDLFDDEGFDLLMRGLDFCAKQLERARVDESQPVNIPEPDVNTGSSVSVGRDVSGSAIIVGNNNVIHVTLPPTAQDEAAKGEKQTAEDDVQTREKAEDENESNTQEKNEREPQTKIWARLKIPIFLLASVAIIGILLWRLMMTIPIMNAPTPSLQNPQTDIELVTTNGQRIFLEVDNQVLLPGNVIETGKSLTAAFTIINNGTNAATIKSLVIGARGPGVSCEDPNSQKWAASQIPFPASPLNIVLQPGQLYKYEGSRVFYIPGNYFLEPVMQGPNGDWGGITPFSCIDITVHSATFTVVPPTNILFTATPSLTPIPASRDVIISEKDGMKLHYVPAGPFMMGSDNDNADEKPAHIVTLDAFWIDETEVTNFLYAKCVSADKCNVPSSNSDKFLNGNYADHPVTNVSWNDASAYCSWANRRLPSEAEWEKAARGPNGNIYPWGNTAPNNNLLNYHQNGGSSTQVGLFQNGKSFYGALDMAGNVWEWTNDWYSSIYYANSPSLNPLGPVSGTVRVLRGGSWNLNISFVRSSSRYSDFYPDSSSYDIGFRCALSAQ